ALTMISVTADPVFSQQESRTEGVLSGLAGLFGPKSNGNATKSVTVKKVSVFETDNGMEGATGELVIKVDKNHDERPAVGIMEEFSGGQGNMSKGSAWVAVIVASNVTGIRVTDYEFTFKSYGFSDGPSAGMLSAAALIALINGHEIRKDTTMTGTVNPDGTCGPVGGIEFKMRGAAAAGLKRFGYPRGSRLDQKTEKGVVGDLKAHGENLGLETKEIDDVYEAYEFLTGKKLSVTAPIDTEEMAFSPAISGRLNAELTSQLAELRELRVPLPSTTQTAAILKKNPNALSPSTSAALQAIDALFSSAERHLSEGELAAATVEMSQVATACRVAKGSWDLVSGGNGKLPPAKVLALCKDRITGVALKVDAARLECSSEVQMTDVANFSNSLSANIGMVEAEGFLTAARREYAQMEHFMSLVARLENERGNDKDLNQITTDLQKQFSRKIIDSFERINVYLARAETKAGQSTRFFLVSDQPSPLKVDDHLVRLESRKYLSGGSSVLTYFRAIHLEEVAKAEQESVSQVADKYSTADPVFMSLTYANAEISRMQLPVRGERGDKSVPSVELLGRGLFCYLGGSALTTKNYALGVSTDRISGQIQVSRRSATGWMLDAARARLLEQAQLVKAKVGTIPHSVKFNYQVGEAFRNRPTDQEQLNSLSAYWQAISICEIINSTISKE
ncbi:MAG: hypothetical protein EOP06_07150, partial [Proteobacteria bacterium]